MTEHSDSDRYAFGELYPISRDRFGHVNGGALGGGFQWLLDHSDRERGFFSKTDRRRLLKTLSLNLSDPSERNARQRIRNRVVLSFFDARYLRYISPRDREIIFDNLRDEGYDLHFREGFKEFVRFTYLGLLENDYDIDVQEILESAIQEAEQEYALGTGRNETFDVDIEVKPIEGDSIEELEKRYSNHERLTRRELSVLINSQHENAAEGVTSGADIDLVDALYYDARQPESDPHGYSWEDPDREEAEEIVDWLRSIFEEYEIGTHRELEVTMERISLHDEELGQELKSKLSRLSRAAPNFDSQMALDADLPESDMEILHHILWNPEKMDVETVLKKKARPPTAGDSWDPAEDEYLQKFIARVEATGTPTGGEEGLERWSEVLQLADFDEDEWVEYMQEQRVKQCVDEVEEWLDEDNINRDLIKQADSWEEFWESLPTGEASHFHMLASLHGDDVMNAALEAIDNE